MATRRCYKCVKCGKETPVGQLLSTLLNFPKSIPICASCGGTNELYLTPPFALGAGGQQFKVLDAFHESVSWRNENEVTFYPFLIILQYVGEKGQKIWLPYWHIDGGKVKFGERAPWMDSDLFVGLFNQAYAKGYLQPERAITA